MKLRGWTAFAVGLVLCLGVAYGAYTLANYSWNQVVDYRGPYAAEKLPPATDPSVMTGETTDAAAAHRCVFVIIDGLREDVSRTMPNLNNLRNHGFDAVVKTAQPSLSFPNWTTLLSGTQQRFSGVTTNWFTGRVPVETLVDVALASGRTVAVSAPKDFEMLYGVERTGHAYLRDWTEGQYMTGDIVDHAISLATGSSASLVIVHFPDVDEAGHAYGGASKSYRETALKVDADLGRLVKALQGPNTTFIVASDHGHIDTGGHGGPEPVVTEVPAVFAGAGVRPGTGTGTQDQVGPAIALLAGLPALRNASGEPLDVTAVPRTIGDRFDAQQANAYTAYTAAVKNTSWAPVSSAEASAARAAFAKATDERLARERLGRLPVSLALVAAALLALVAIGVLSRQALLSALAGVVGYYAVWDGSYFLAHGYRWSLSFTNSEALLKGFLNGRLTDAILAGAVAAAVAALTYIAVRKDPKRAAGAYLSGWVALGVATVVAIQATLVIQVAWYLWYWGASLTWYIPDLALGFKYDLDLLQLAGLGAAAVLAPVVTFLIGRYHPSLRTAKRAS